MKDFGVLQVGTSAYISAELAKPHLDLRITTPLLGLLIAGAGCDSSSDQDPPKAAASAATSVVATPPAVPAGPPPERTLDQKKRRFKSPVIYVDGEPKGVVRITELPGSLPVSPEKLVDGRMVDRYHWSKYFTAVGVDLAKVKAVYFHGGRTRVSMVPGDMVRKFPDTLRFSFTRGDRGKARMHYPGTDDFVVNTTIDKVQAISVFIEKEPPEFIRRTRKFKLPDGTEVDGIPYVPAESTIKGTRFYVDGMLLGAVKRRKIPDAWLAAGSDELNPMFLLTKVQEDMGVEEAPWKVVQFTQGDFVVAQLTLAQWHKYREELVFSLPRHNRGRVSLTFPDAVTTPEGKPVGTIHVDSVLFFKDYSPRVKEISVPAEHRTPDGDGSSDPQDED